MPFSLRVILIIIGSVLVTTASARVRGNIVTRGFYLGVQRGFSNVNYKNDFAPGYQATSISTSGAATRVEGGFDITKNFGALLSVTYFRKPQFHNINGTSSSKIKNNLIFFALKGMLPLSRRFVIYANAGVGYIARSQVTVDNAIVLSNAEIVRPVYGLGAAYLLLTRFAITFTWIQASQKPSDHLPTSNFVGGGAQYKFAT